VGVTGNGPDGLPFAIRASFVIGADGIRSTVARLVNAPVEYQGQHASAVTYGYWTGADVRDYEWAFVQEAAAGAMPTNYGQTCVFASSTPERLGRGGVDVIHSVVGASAPDLADRLLAARAPSNAITWHGQTGFIRRAWGDGWALVGDAGYFKDPLAAHGMSDALRDAELLARALAAVHAGAQEAEALADYRAQRDALALPMLQVTDRIASHHWSGAEIRELLKQMSKFVRDEARLLKGLDLSEYSMQPSKGVSDDQHQRLDPHAVRHAA